MSARYTLRLTERQLWHLKDSYEASFTEPESMNSVERGLARKLRELYQQAFKDKQRVR